MKNILGVLLMLSMATTFADDAGNTCGFYVKMSKLDQGYQVIAASNEYINAPNVLYTVYDLKNKNIKLLTIPTRDHSGFKCDSGYDYGNEDGYCTGDFVLNEEVEKNKANTGNDVTSSIENITNSLNGFLGGVAKISNNKKKQEPTPFTPYPNPATIKIAQDHSDLLTSQYTKVQIENCEQVNAKQMAQKKAEEERLKQEKINQAKMAKQNKSQPKATNSFFSRPGVQKCMGIELTQFTTIKKHPNGECASGYFAYGNCTRAAKGDGVPVGTPICQVYFMISYSNGGRHGCEVRKGGLNGYGICTLK